MVKPPTVKESKPKLRIGRYKMHIVEKLSDRRGYCGVDTYLLGKVTLSSEVIEDIRKAGQICARCIQCVESKIKFGRIKDTRRIKWQPGSNTTVK